MVLSVPLATAGTLQGDRHDGLDMRDVWRTMGDNTMTHQTSREAAIKLGETVFRNLVGDIRYEMNETRQAFDHHRVHCDRWVCQV
jgi:hypothetical protein